MTGSRFGTEAGLSYNPTNGLLYNINSEDRNTPGFTRGVQLYSIVPATGAATAIGSLQADSFVDGLGINASGAASTAKSATARMVVPYSQPIIGRRVAAKEAWRTH